jgi:hypothetical protein
MLKIKALMVVAGTTIALLAAGAPAQAQATRTWVSGVGDDVNPCSRTAPCKTFAGAISKTATGGYINCLDPGGFGAVTITKAITIQCEEEIGHVLVAGTNGLVVFVANGTNVTLRGLTIESANGGSPGVNGILLNQGGNLHLQEVVVTGAWTQNAIAITPNTGVAQVHIVDTYVTDSGSNGIKLAPTAGAAINAELNRVSLENNNNGLVADGTGGIVNVVMRETVAGNGSGIGIQGTSTASAVSVEVDRATVAAYGTGVNANGAQATVRIGNSTITNNVTGVSTTASGNLRTYKNNQINGNLSDGTPIANVDLPN